MSDLPWLEYGGQTTDDLVALEDRYRVDSLVVAMEMALRTRAENSSALLSQLNLDERVVVVVAAMEREVNSGGFESLFASDEAVWVPFLIEGLQAIGCPKVAALADKAIKRLKIKGPLSADAIRNAVDGDDEKLSDALSALDEKYYESAGDLAPAVWDHIKKHRTKIKL